MSVFTEDDVKSLSSEGNVAFNAKYMANYNTHDPVPNGSDIAKLKEFIRAKYLDRKWYNDGTGGNNNANNNLGGGAGAAGVTRGASRRSIYDNEPESAVQSKGFGGGFQIKPQQRTSVYDHDQSTQAVAQELDLLSMSDPVAVPPAQASSTQFGNFDPFGDAPSNQPQQQPQKRPSGNATAFDAFSCPQRHPSGNSSTFDAFGGAPQQQQQQKRPSGGFDNFGVPSNNTSNGFDAFGTSASNGSGGAFDPFAGNSNTSSGFDAFSSPAPKQGGFNADFQQNNNLPQQFGGGFSNFNSPPPQSAPQAPMPFIKLAPPAPEPTPARAATPESTPAAPPAKNFSAFDDLLEPASSAPLPGLGGATQTANPFDAPHAGAAHSHPAGAQPAAPFGGHQQYPPHSQSQHPVGYPPAAPYGYPPQQQHPGYPPQYPGQQHQHQPYPPRGPGGPPHGYPPQQPHPGYPPHGGHAQHPGYPPAPGGYPPQPHAQQYPGYPPNAGYPYPPHGGAPGQPGNHQQAGIAPGSAPAPAAAPAAPVAPDPFASMSGAAWGAVGGKPAPSTPYVSSPGQFGAPSPVTGAPSPTGSATGSQAGGYTPTPNQTAYTSATSPAPAPATSVNPFDMF